MQHLWNQEYIVRINNRVRGYINVDIELLKVLCW